MPRFTVLRAVLVAAAVLGVSAACVADVPTRPSERTPNREPGYCGFCALETLGKAVSPQYPDDANYAKLCGLVELRAKLGGDWVDVKQPDGRLVRQYTDAGASTPDIVRRQLDALGVAYTDRPPVPSPNPGGLVKDWDFVKDACDRGVGAMVGVVGMPGVCVRPDGRHMSHALAAVRVSPEKLPVPGNPAVKEYALDFIDSNNTKVVYRVNQSFFTHYWSGWAVVPEPRGRRVVPQAPPPAGGKD